MCTLVCVCGFLLHSHLFTLLLKSFPFPHLSFAIGAINRYPNLYQSLLLLLTLHHFPPVTKTSANVCFYIFSVVSLSCVYLFLRWPLIIISRHCRMTNRLFHHLLIFSSLLTVFILFDCAFLFLRVLESCHFFHPSRECLFFHLLPPLSINGRLLQLKKTTSQFSLDNFLAYWCLTLSTCFCLLFSRPNWLVAGWPTGRLRSIG